MKNEKAYLVGRHHHQWKAGEPLEIIGVLMVNSDGSEPKGCFHLKAVDGNENFVPIDEIDSYQIISETSAVDMSASINPCSGAIESSMFVGGPVTCPRCHQTHSVINDGGINGDPAFDYLERHKAPGDFSGLCDGGEVANDFGRTQGWKLPSDIESNAYG